jgi:hypothetical protein
MRPRQIATAVITLLVLLASGCNQNVPVEPQAGASAGSQIQMSASGSAGDATIQPSGDIFLAVNTGLEGRGEKYRLAIVEYITSPTSGEYGATIFAKDVGNKQLGHHFVSGDPRRGGGTFIGYIVDQTQGGATGGLTLAQTELAIDQAMNTWGQATGSPAITKFSTFAPVDLGYVQFLLGFGGIPGWFTDITHAGWLPGAFFNAVQPGGSSFILGVTFTFLWVDGSGNFTDIDGDHKLDVAFREIYYNNAFTWSVSAPAWSDPQVDVETIALHEAGHGLSQGHFGTIFNDGKGTKEPGFQLEHLHFSPRAVMNAVYWETQRELLGTDAAGHSSIWSNWGH